MFLNISARKKLKFDTILQESISIMIEEFLEYAEEYEADNKRTHEAVVSVKNDMQQLCHLMVIRALL